MLTNRFDYAINESCKRGKMMELQTYIKIRQVEFRKAVGIVHNGKYLHIGFNPEAALFHAYVAGLLHGIDVKIDIAKTYYAVQKMKIDPWEVKIVPIK